ncbi:hypothetical protein [Roseomonas sp. HF4]|uniref:hypothetical protein n=1 Tax=Roseomonas sp. HF4 TaxID=2562313 RepID=UPI0010C00E8A|nr:hypothetical protein [Roseomonas sp. HF4]
MSRDPPQPLPPAVDPAFAARVLAGMPPDLAARLDARLLFALQQTLGGWDGVERRGGRHIRIALPFGVWRVTFARVSGPGFRAFVRSRPALAAAMGVAVGALLAGVAGLLLG